MRVALLLAGVWGLTVAQGLPAEDRTPKPPYERLLKGDDARKAAELDKKISALIEADNYAEAIQVAEELLALRQRVQGADHHEAVDVQWGLDALRKVAGLPAERRAAWRAAVKAQGQAEALEAKVRYGEAWPWRKKMLDLCRELLGDEHPDTARSYNNLGMNLHAQGKYAEAEPLVRRALAIWQKVRGEEHPDTAASYHNLALNLDAQGKYAEAEPVARAAVASLEAARLRVAASGLERAAAQRFDPRLEWAIALVHLGKPRDAWQALEGHLGRGLLDDYSARQGVKLPPEEQRQLDQINARLTQFDKQISDLFPRPGGLEKHGKEFEKLAAERTKVQQELARLAAAIHQREVYDLTRIQRQLPKDAALVCWLDISGEPKAANRDGEHWGFLLKATGDPIVVKLPGSGQNGAWTKEDDELPERVRAAISQRPEDPRAEWQAVCRRLAAQRLGPLAAHLRGVKQLVVLPSAALRGIPLEVLTDQFLVSYAPSGTLVARLQEQRPRAAGLSVTRARLLAVGDPVFLPPAKPHEVAKPPDYGVYLAQVQPGSNAAAAGLRQGDVLLTYAGTKLSKPEDLKLVEAGEAVPVQVWRDGQVLEVKVQPGRLGVVLSRQAAAAAVTAAREGAAAVAALDRGPTLEPLPGSRREVEAIARLFPHRRTLLGREAQGATLRQWAAEGVLGQFDVIHLATHGLTDPYVAFRSAVVLSQAPGDPGTLTAQEMKEWRLQAEVVVLSACESGLGRYGGGEGYLGFTQALFLAGTRSLVLSWWKVDDRATALLMVRFYENLLGQRAGLKRPLAKIEALREAKAWLRNLSVEEVEAALARLPAVARGKEAKLPPVAPPGVVKPFAHPSYWSACILVGDRGE